MDITVSLYLAMTVLLSFLKLVENALRTVLSLIKVSADVSQPHNIAFYNPQKR